MKNNNKLHEDLHKNEKNNKHILKLVELSHDNFTMACILSGCDYLESMKGMGLKTALDYVKNINDLEDLKNSISSNKKFDDQFTEEYETDFKDAYYAFKYQRIWDSRLLRSTTLHKMENHISSDEVYKVIGQEIDLLEMKKHIKGGEYLKDDINNIQLLKKPNNNSILN